MQPVITPRELAALLCGPDPPAVADVRWSLAGPGRADYQAGHLPGAVYLDVDSDLAGRRWLAPTRLRELAQRWGAGGAEVGAYCGSGINACALVLGLERAGVTTPQRPAALYAGSWSQWCIDPARPVATGPDPG